jgi:ABC-type phosphate transport system substrate-binding protein
MKAVAHLPGGLARLAGGAALVALLGAATPALAQVVVVGAKSPVTSLSKEQASDIFLGKMLSLPGGGAAELIDQPESSALRDEFYSKVAGKSAAQAKQYWSKLAFTGKGTPPKEAGGSAEVKRMVAANPNAIGYIEKSAVDGSVKAVFSAQ